MFFSKLARQMAGNSIRILALALACVAAIVSSASAADRPAVQEVREETWADGHFLTSGPRGAASRTAPVKRSFSQLLQHSLITATEWREILGETT
jgi:hypothetical protein